MEAPNFHRHVLAFFKKPVSDEEGLVKLKEFYKGYEEFYPNRGTLKRRLSEARKVIKENQSANLYKLSTYSKYFNLPEAERDAQKRAYIAKIKTANASKIQIDGDVIQALMVKLATSINIYDKIILGLLVSGCRPVELLGKSTFERVEGKPSFVKMGLVAKKRGEEAKTFTLEKPILSPMTPKKFITLVKQVRKRFENKKLYENGLIASDKLNTLNLRVVSHLPMLVDSKNKSSFCRKIYASLAYQEYADPKLENFNLFIERVLGHNSLLTSFSYSFVEVSKPTVVPVEIDEVPDRVWERLPRISPEADKEQLMEEIYQWKPSISNLEMRKKSFLGSKTVNLFLRRKNQPSAVSST